MIIAHNEYHAESSIEVNVYRTAPSNEPILMRLTDGTTIHMSIKDASKLHLELTAALYEYEEE